MALWNNWHSVHAHGHGLKILYLDCCVATVHANEPEATERTIFSFLASDSFSYNLLLLLLFVMYKPQSRV